MLLAYTYSSTMHIGGNQLNIHESEVLIYVTILQIIPA